jgi:tRNA pseudouridine13 synthase
LKINPKSFSFAGTKDKRATTVQRIAVYKENAMKLASLNKKLNGMKVGDFSYEKTKLSLADSQGNHFKIAMRHVQIDKEQTFYDSLESLKTKGFINYYGMQRFGTRSVSTYTVGIAILSNNFEKACSLILGLNEIEKPEMVEARNLWLEHKDAKGALAKFPKHCIAERCILESIIAQKDKINYLNCIQKIPRNLRLMYAHSYQSLVWNNVASFRYQKYGMDVVVGDLVQKEFEDPIHVTEETISQYSIYEVVLPIPGHSVKYPQNQVFEKYKEFMAKDGFDPLSMTSKIHENNLPGSYRKIICKPRNVSGKLIHYDDDETFFIKNDLDILENKPDIVYPTSKCITNKDGDKIAIIVEFTLGSSQYATMALREMTKEETSSSYHSSLSQNLTES